jgi:hypothetical protein
MTKEMIWVMPEAIAMLFEETLQMDSESSWFDPELRTQLKHELQVGKQYTEENYRELVLKKIAKETGE